MNTIIKRIIKMAADEHTDFDPNEWIEYYKRKPLSTDRLYKLGWRVHEFIDRGDPIEYDGKTITCTICIESYFENFLYDIVINYYKNFKQIDLTDEEEDALYKSLKNISSEDYTKIINGEHLWDDDLERNGEFRKAIRKENFQTIFTKIEILDHKTDSYQGGLFQNLYKVKITFLSEPRDITE